MECDVYLGIDPGKDGALIFINDKGQIIDKFVIPTLGKVYDLQSTITVLSKYKIKHAVLEDVHAHQMSGTSTAFEFGAGKMMLEMGLACLKIPYTMIQAKEWQSQMWIGIKKITTPTTRKKANGDIVGKVDTKATSLIAVQRLFPDEKLTPPNSIRAVKPHSGIVDAILIAEYCRRNFR